MRYEWQRIRNGNTPADMMVLYCNTPTGCMTDEGADDQPLVVSHPGLNLTPDGDWIQAPGLESRGPAEQREVEGLRCVIADLLRECSELRDSNSKVHAELERFKTIEVIAGKYNEEEYDAMRTKVDDLEQCLANAKHDYLERAGDLNHRLKAIETWCEQPAGNALLRTAQAYVLKLVRGEA